MMNDLVYNADRPWSGDGRLVFRHSVTVTTDGRRETIYLPDPEEASRLGRRLQAEAMHRGLATAGRWIAGQLRRAAAAIVRWRQERRNSVELGRLSDHMLRDIGLDRGEIPSVARALANGAKMRAGKAEVHDLRDGSEERTVRRDDPRIAA